MRLTYDEIEAARRRIQGHVRLTPTLLWQPPEIAGLGHANGGGGAGGQVKVTLKLEYLQVSGSFKARGACNMLLAEDASRITRGVVTASGGNHGLGVAYAASRVGAQATVFLPENAPASTERRLASFGATAVREGLVWDDAWRAAVAFAERTGALVVHPFEDRAVMAGQGTIGLELVEQQPDLDMVIVAIGGGGLISGVSSALHAKSPSIRVIGVEPEGAPSMKRSVDAGHVVELSEVKTIAGTLAPRAVGPNTLSIASVEVAQITLVSDDELRSAMKRLWDDLRILVEPAGAAAVAALLSGRVSLEGARSVGVLVCGANLDASMASSVIAG